MEPYKVQSVQRRNEVKYVYDVLTKQIRAVPSGLYSFEITYRNYLRENRFRLEAKDELEAYMLGQKRLDKTKTHYDKYGKNKP